MRTGMHIFTRTRTLWYSACRTRTHARTHARTHTHAHTHTRELKRVTLVNYSEGMHLGARVCACVNMGIQCSRYISSVCARVCMCVGVCVMY